MSAAGPLPRRSHRSPQGEGTAVSVPCPRPGHAASPALAAELLALCQARLSRIECLRSVDFADSLPRNEHGKLLK